MEKKEIYTREEAAELLGYCTRYLASKRMKNMLPYMRDMMTGRIFYKREVLKKYLETRKPRVGLKQVILD